MSGDLAFPETAGGTTPPDRPGAVTTARPSGGFSTKRWSIRALVTSLVVIQVILISGLIAVASVIDFDEARVEATFGVGVGAVFLVLFVAWGINRRIAGPIRALAAAVDEATHGNLSCAVPTEGPAELVRVGERFNATLAMRAEAEAVLVEAYETERRAADQLRELDELKNAFLISISHELRTPLTSVVGYASLLEEELPALAREEAVEFARAVSASARRLERLLLDLLDLERLTRGVMEPRRRPTDMRELVRRVLEHTAMDQRVEIDIAKGTEANVDPALLERVVENLIVNATKHTPAGTLIRVGAVRRESELLLTVEDAGQGVPDEMKAAIFQPFRSAHKVEHSPGMGIGLALVAEFARLHGGRAWVEDRPGGGSLFRVAIPSAPSGPQRLVS